MSELTHARTVLVDMDGVMADFETPNDEIVEAYGVVPVLNRTDFYYADTYRDQPGLRQEIYQANRQPGFFRGFPVIEGAVEGWSRILEAGFTPRVCSSPLEDHPTVVTEKKAWLEEHFVSRFGGWVVETAIFDRDKSGYEASTMIDDRPTLRGMEGARWQHMLFARSYNSHIATDFRLNGWQDARLEALLERCHDLYTTMRQ